MKKILITGILMAALAFSLTGCNDEPEDGEDLKEQEEQEEEVQEEEEEVLLPGYGGILKIGGLREDTLHPYGVQQRETRDAYHLLFEGLMILDKNGKPQGRMIEDYEPAEDGQSIFFRLRDELLWHDGEEITLQDLRFTLRWLREADEESLSHEGKNAQRVAKQITDIRESDEGEMEVIFSRPFSNALNSLTFWILPQHIYEGREMDEITVGDLIGTGPFQVSEEQSEEGLHLEKVEEHPIMDSFIEGVFLQWYESENEKEGAFQEGDLDLLWAEHYGYMDSEDFETLSPLGNRYEFLAFNHRDDNYFSREPRLRHLLSGLIHREEMIDASYHGFGEAASIPIHPRHYLFHDVTDHRDREELLELWEEELSDLGFRMGEDRFYVKDSNEVLQLRILVDQDAERQVNSAMILARELMELGVQVTLEQRSGQEIVYDLETGNFQSYLGAWFLSPVSDLAFAFHSTQIHRGNLHFYQSDALDAKIEEAFRAPNTEIKREVYGKIGEYLYREQPGIGLYFLKDPVAINPRLMGVETIHPDHLLFFMEEWYLETR